MKSVKWCENVILVDGDHLDKVTFNLIVNFERMLARRIPNADLPHWLDCVALDSGLRPTADSQNDVQVVFLHKNDKLANFTPGDYSSLNGKAFKDDIAEFSLIDAPIGDSDEEILNMENIFCDVLQPLLLEKGIKHLMLIPNAEVYINKVKQTVKTALSSADYSLKDIIVFAMQPIAANNFKSEILGYSLMSALGISSKEIEEGLR